MEYFTLKLDADRKMHTTFTIGSSINKLKNSCLLFLAYIVYLAPFLQIKTVWMINYCLLKICVKYYETRYICPVFYCKLCHKRGMFENILKICMRLYMYQPIFFYKRLSGTQIYNAPLQNNILSNLIRE